MGVPHWAKRCTRMLCVHPVKAGGEQGPLQLRPGLCLALFSYGMLLVWMDQGTISATSVQGVLPDADYSDYGNQTVPGLVPDLGMSTSQYSLLGPMYTIGLVVGSFLFAALAHPFNAMRLLSSGGLLWAIGSIIAGVSPSYGVMILARLVGGTGAASVMTLTFPYIDDVAPPKLRTVWFGVLGLCQPVGLGLGYILMGGIADADGWRTAFFVQAALCAPFVVGTLAAPAMALKGHQANAWGAPHVSSTTDLIAHAPGEADTAGSMATGMNSSAGGGWGGGGCGGGTPAASPSRRKREGAAVAGGGCELLLGSPTSAQVHRRAQAAAEGSTWVPPEIVLNGPAAPLGTNGPASESSYATPASAAAAEGGQEAGSTSAARSRDASGPRRHNARVSSLQRRGAWAWPARLRRWLSNQISPQGPWSVLRCQAWELSNWGYVPIEFVLQVYAYWGPRVVKSMYSGTTNSTADFAVGGTAIAAGVVGSIGGGVLLDAYGSSLSHAFLFSLTNVTSAAIILSISMAITSLPFGWFLVLTGLGLVMATSVNPINYAVSMWSVPLSARPMSQALVILSQRVVADIPAPPVAAAIKDALGDWRITSNIVLCVLAISMVLYALGLATAHKARDFRAEYDAQESAAIMAFEQAQAEAEALEAAEKAEPEMSAGQESPFVAPDALSASGGQAASRLHAEFSGDNQGARLQHREQAQAGSSWVGAEAGAPAVWVGERRQQAEQDAGAGDVVAGCQHRAQIGMQPLSKPAGMQVFGRPLPPLPPAPPAPSAPAPAQVQAAPMVEECVPTHQLLDQLVQQGVQDLPQVQIRLQCRPASKLVSTRPPPPRTKYT